jgi:hypothetical protein
MRHGGQSRDRQEVCYPPVVSASWLEPANVNEGMDDDVMCGAELTIVAFVVLLILMVVIRV